MTTNLVSVQVYDSICQDLKAIAQLDERSLTDTINRALSLYCWLKKKEAKGCKSLIEERNGELYLIFLDGKP